MADNQYRIRIIDFSGHTSAEEQDGERELEADYERLQDLLEEEDSRRAPALPVEFEGRAFSRDDVPDAWYGCLSEWDMIGHVKAALAAGQQAAAAAMALELMGFPATWADVKREEAEYQRRYREPWPRDAELTALVRGVWPASRLTTIATIWECYKAIVCGAAAGSAGSAALFGAMARTSRH